MGQERFGFRQCKGLTYIILYEICKAFWIISLDYQSMHGSYDLNFPYKKGTVINICYLNKTLIFHLYKFTCY